jgi:indolepyruvate ferredoxin oxidoreductase alpha subunit
MDELIRKKLFSGNQAIAWGAIESGVQVVTGYPGTPSTEIIETLLNYGPKDKIYIEWSTNEIVALEVAAGAALTGLKAMTCMKHVGLNVALDFLMSINLIGVSPLLIVVVDDPHAYNSQNDQDSRLIAILAHLPLIEPASPQEAKDSIKLGFKLSKKFNLPVIIRLTNKLSHSTEIVGISEISKRTKKPVFNKRFYAAGPGFVNPAHDQLHKKLDLFKKFAENFPLNSISLGKSKFGIITSGYLYSLVKEVTVGKEVSIFKVGTPCSIPVRKLEYFLSKVNKVLVIEESEPVIEREVLFHLGRTKNNVKIKGRFSGDIPWSGEITHEIILNALNFGEKIQIKKLPPRFIALCPGCPHIASYYALKLAIKESRKKCVVNGDIGCYTLGGLTPINVLQTTFCMGGGIGVSGGMSITGLDSVVISVIGDSTFFHAGLPGLINCVYNNAKIKLIILDNRTTAMTGFQPHPGTGITALGKKHHKISISKLAKALGIKFVKKVDPYNINETKEVMLSAIKSDSLAVVICERACVIKERVRVKQKKYVITESCTNCKICLQLGCPALNIKDGKIELIRKVCVSCGVCIQICPKGAIKT